VVSGEQDERETYRVIVLGRGGADVLLVPNREYHMLPWVEIPRWQRVAENLTIALKSGWGEEAVCLFEPTTELPADGRVAGYQATEHLRSCGNSKMPTRWVPVSNVRQDLLIDARDGAALRQVVAMCNGEIEASSAAPFARLGWLCELRNWIESVIEPMGLNLNGKFRQLNASASFSLVRFETSGPALWFKAVGEPNQREFAITCALAQIFPGYLPSILSSRPDWNGWLSQEIPGNLLSHLQGLVLWERAAADLARLQIQSIDRGCHILGAGARDLGSAALSELIQPFMGVVEQLMERQTRVPPPVLDRQDLVVLADSLHSALGATEATGIPETLGHLDLNPGNIIVSENRTVFMDWAEAYVGNPLFSLQYLLQHARRALGGDPAVETSLTKAYCAQWGSTISPTAISNALAFTPLLAVFAYAAGSDAWKRSQQLQAPATAGYLRSLARRMHREAQQLVYRRSLCLH
jgi:phosphotransferase family enzyme